MLIVLKQTCPGNEVWSECGRSCQASCGAISLEIPCSEECIPGCTCPEGKVRDYDNNCLAVQLCPCNFDEVKYMPGESRMLVNIIVLCSYFSFVFDLNMRISNFSSFVFFQKGLQCV